MSTLLHGKTAVVHGAGGGIGSAVSRAFAHEGARVFLAGRSQAPLEAELGPAGVRVCGIWTAGVAETLTRDRLAAVGGDQVPSPDAVIEMISGMAALRRTPRLADVAEAAVFLASDRAAGITGSITNVTAGLALQ